MTNLHEMSPKAQYREPNVVVTRYVGQLACIGIIGWLAGMLVYHYFG
jgi:hypothetical protein